MVDTAGILVSTLPSNGILLFYTQLAAITASRPGPLLHLRYQDLGLKLVRDPEEGRPSVVIFLKPEFTKRFLGKKAP